VVNRKWVELSFSVKGCIKKIYGIWSTTINPYLLLHYMVQSMFHLLITVLMTDMVSKVQRVRSANELKTCGTQVANVHNTAAFS
jgi:hypothetical protein